MLGGIQITTFSKGDTLESPALNYQFVCITMTMEQGKRSICTMAPVTVLKVYVQKSILKKNRYYELMHGFGEKPPNVNAYSSSNNK